MSLTLIGLGLSDSKDITLKGLEAIKKADIVYLEHYTAVLHSNVDELETVYGRKIVIAPRNFVEDAQQLLHEAASLKVCLLIVGDVFSATTHADLFLRAKEAGVVIEVIYNASIMTAIGITGLQLYKFGKTTSLVFFDDKWKPQTAYDVIKANKSLGYHTLVLLDIKVAESSKDDILHDKDNALSPRFMTIHQGITELLEIEGERNEQIFTQDTFCVGVARIGNTNQTIIAGNAQELLKKDFGAPMHCLIVPASLHFHEEEVLIMWK